MVYLPVLKVAGGWGSVSLIISIAKRRTIKTNVRKAMMRTQVLRKMVRGATEYL
jgi:hypothetical protein